MDLPQFQSGFATAWADVKQFLVGVRFARPAFIWLSLLPIAFAVLGYFAAKRKRKQIAEFGRPAAVAGLATRYVRSGRLARFLLGLAWTALVLGIAGPRWGKTTTDGVAVGRDLVVVIDLSRSMLATDLTTTDARWQSAVNAVRGLIEYARTRGGHRIGIVVFAARPKVWVPLTTDYNHLETKLDDLDAARPPNDIRPADDAVKSGTRIGAALKLAVETHDRRFTGAQDILLLTDADDPESDREWATGVTAARSTGIPVHVVGIGDPHLKFQLDIKTRDDPIFTQLEQDVAKAIATEGRGQYLAAHRDPAQLNEFFRTKIEPFPSRSLPDDEPTTQLLDRSVWFFLAAAVLLALGWLRER